MRSLLLLTVLMLPATALASGGDDGHGFDYFYLIDFIVFAAIIRHFAAKPIQTFLQTRRENLMSEIEEANRLKEEAHQRLEEYTQRIASLDSEREQIKQDFLADGARERDRIVAEAEATAVRLVEDAQRRIEGEARRLQIALEEEAVQLAVTLVESTAKQRMDAALQTQLVEESIQVIESLEQGSLGSQGA